MARESNRTQTLPFTQDEQMRNRNKSVPLRTPLLGALDVEYARASKAKNLDRMAEIAAAIEALSRVWPELAAQAGEQPTQLHVPAALSGSVPSMKFDDIPTPAELPPAPGESSLQDILARVDELEWPDAERRVMALDRIKSAALNASRITLDQQIRYEVAFQAHNRNVGAMELMQPEAKIRNVTVDELAQHIITDRRTKERRMAYVYAILARAEAEIAQAVGARIDELAEAAIQEIGAHDHS